MRTRGRCTSWILCPRRRRARSSATSCATSVAPSSPRPAMPDRDLVLADDADGIRTLVLNRPAQLNAFDQALCAALTDALRSAATDDAVRVVVVTGSGRAFSAGTDLVELAASGDFRGTTADPERFERLIDALAACPKPLVCAVNGIAVGIGATMLGL